MDRDRHSFERTTGIWFLRPLAERTLAVAAICYMIAATSWSMPEGFPMKGVIDDAARPVFTWAGLWQGWDMFAPNPRDEDIYVSAEVHFQDGTGITRIMTRMTDFPYLERYRLERWRKYFNDNMRLDSNKALWDPTAAWIARDTWKKTGRPVARVELARHWRKSLLPGEAGNVLDDRRPFNRFVFHEWPKGAK